MLRNNTDSLIQNSDSNSQGTLDLDTRHYISVYLLIYFCIIISSKPRIAVIRFENLLVAMAIFHQASKLGLEGKSLGISLLDGGPGGKGMLDMNMR
jgi:hypothetical protein